MNTLRVLRYAVLVAAAAVSMTACVGTSPGQADPDYRHRPPTSGRVAGPPAEGAGQRLILQSGEGETLNVPWFVRDAQDLINTY